MLKHIKIGPELQYLLAIAAAGLGAAGGFLKAMKLEDDINHSIDRLNYTFAPKSKPTTE